MIASIFYQEQFLVPLFPHEIFCGSTVNDRFFIKCYQIKLYAIWVYNNFYGSNFKRTSS